MMKMRAATVLRETSGPSAAPAVLHLHVGRVVIHGGDGAQWRWKAATLADTLQHLLDQPHADSPTPRPTDGSAELAAALRDALEAQLGRIDRPGVMPPFGAAGVDRGSSDDGRL